MDVEGKAAVITGASRGVGRATALALAEKGCAVLINYSASRDEAEAVVREVEEVGAEAFACQADVSDDAACRKMVDAAVEAFGRVDILVNNAGTTSFIPHNDLERVTEDVWDRILNVNLKGPFHCARAVRKHMEEAGEGEIVNVASVAGVAGMGSSIPYCASKAALINLNTTLARALGPAIRVNTVAPGFIEGRWLEQGLGENYQTVKKANEHRAVLGKVCKAEDVAAAIMSIIEGSDLVTGQTIVCDGGMLIGPKL